MTPLLLDTHAWAWSLNEPARLRAGAREALAASPVRYVSPISFYEIGQKVRLGRWPEMEALQPRLASIVDEQGAQVAVLTADICLAAATLAWDHRDPIDRILAATCLAEGLSLVSADPAFDSLPAADGRLRRIW